MHTWLAHDTLLHRTPLGTNPSTQANDHTHTHTASTSSPNENEQFVNQIFQEKKIATLTSMQCPMTFLFWPAAKKKLINNKCQDRFFLLLC